MPNFRDPSACFVVPCEQTDTVELGGSQLRHRYAMATSELDSEVEFKRRCVKH